MVVADSQKKHLEVCGVVFSDLGLARAYMSVEWARRAMQEKIGFDPYPGTLNLQVSGDDELARWQLVKRAVTPIVLPSPDKSYCDSHFFMGFLAGWSGVEGARERVAVVVPEVKDYPPDKIEVIAGRGLKTTYSIRDGAELTLSFDCAAGK